MPTIRKRGSRYQAQVRVKRQGRIVHQESATFDTRAQALLWGSALEAKVQREEASVPEETVDGLMHAYSRYRETVRPLSRGMQHSIKELRQAPFAGKNLTELTAKDLLDWGTSRAHSVSPATVAHHFMVLRSAWQSALALVGAEPDMKPLVHAMQALKRVKLMAKSKQRERRVTDAELHAICLHLMGKPLQIPTDVYVRLAVALPRRREEICSMLWADYTGLTVRLRDTKNPTQPRDEVVPVPPAARAIIDALPRLDARIFPYKPESVSAAFQRAVREIGLADIRLHDLRHEGISRLFEQSLQIQEVSLISGHLSWASLKRYTHIKPLNVVEKLNARIRATSKATAEPSAA